MSVETCTQCHGACVVAGSDDATDRPDLPALAHDAAGRPRVLAVGRYADVARAWRHELGPYLSIHSGDPRTHRLYGKAAESARFGLHIIGRGTFAIAEVTP